MTPIPLPPLCLSPQAFIQAFREVNDQSDFGLLSNTVLEQTTKLFCAEAASLFLANKTTGDIDVAAVRHVPEECIAAYIKNPCRAAVIAGLFPNQDPWGPASLPHEPLTQLVSAGYALALFFPIRIQEKIIGYLALSSSEKIGALPEVREKLGLFLEFIAQAIENAYLIFQLRQQNSHLELMMTKLQNAQNHIRRAEKMALVGKLAASIAHEIRNPLTVIGASLQWLFEKMEKENPDRRLFDTMITKVRSMDQTIKELMVFARPLQLICKPISLPETMERVTVFIDKKYLLKKISISQTFAADLPKVWADEEQLQRVFINLFLNAYQFVPENGKVHVRSWQDPGQPWMMLSFSDNGQGISGENISRIFEPFFSTQLEGTGLGLFFVKHILEEMNGTIEVKSEPPYGTEFILRLPIAKQA
jgi:signal transduction histidine kinase